MLNIAICDDDSTQLGLLASYTTECIQSHAIGAVIHQFDHPDKLLSSCERQRYHIYILDIVMPMINGLEVGKAIREREPGSIILYATYEPGYALQSFESSPINYLLKPIDKGSCVERCCRHSRGSTRLLIPPVPSRQQRVSGFSDSLKS
jgi:DNA-binding LytR/AlgR family response regulator